MSEPAIALRDLKKRFARFQALDGLSLDIAPGELIAVLGPSGSGKTTLLRTIAGLDRPDAGRILFDGQDVTLASAAARRAGFVFQQYALFPHMTVARNVSFGLDVRKRSERPARAEIDRRVGALLKLVELEGLGARYPGQLSGGQRQRVALSRALAVAPRVLLLDEPFGALDATVRKTLRKELRRIHDATGVTTIFVTHDQEEALELADRVAILNRGALEQVASPAEIYDRPATAFVCGFVGDANRFEGRVSGGRFLSGAVDLPAARIADGPAVAFVRPYDVVPAGTGLAATLRRVVAQGPAAHVEAVLADGRSVEAIFAREAAEGVQAGARLSLSVRQAHVFPADARDRDGPA